MLASGCFRPDDGQEPPPDRIYFPTGLALSSDGNRLYVANSDWDLQFNAGSVQAYDAEAIRRQLPRSCESDADCESSERCQTEPWPHVDGVVSAPSYWCVPTEATEPCGQLGVKPAADRFFEPGLCGPLDNRDPTLLLDSALVGAFATNLIYRDNPSGGGRLFVPVRSDATLHWMDVRGSGPNAAELDRELECGQGAGGECDADHRRGDGNDELSADGESLPIEPFGIAADAEGTSILVAHQTERDVSLFTNDWSVPESGPRLQHVLSDLSSNPVHVAAIPLPRAALVDRQRDPRQLSYQPGFWVTFRGNPFVQLIRYFDEVDAPDGQPYLERASADLLLATAVSDVRGIAVDDSKRSTCEGNCGDDVSCLEVCASVPLEVFCANRAPASILVGNTTSTRQGTISNDRLSMSQVVPIEQGPTRIRVGSVLDEGGRPSKRVFVTSFDGRTLTIYDPAKQSIEARALTGRGPTAIAIDETHGLAYVAHFTDSYIGVIDLDRRHRSYGTMILTLGVPTAPRGDG